MHFHASLFALAVLAGTRVLAIDDAAKLAIIGKLIPPAGNANEGYTTGSPNANGWADDNMASKLTSDGLAARPLSGGDEGGAEELMQSAVKSGELYKNCKDPKSFALTFDDGPYKFGAEIARFLDKHDVKATFFVNGYNYGCIYDYADELIARHKAGHIIASHTWNHADLTKLTPKQIHQELDLVEEALWKILGVKPALFRAPYGSLNAQATQIITSRGYTIVDWSFDSDDSMGKSPAYSIKAYEALSASDDEGPIALNHETHQGTSEEVIPEVVPMLLDKGYRLVTVDECLGVEAYQRIQGGNGKDYGQGGNGIDSGEDKHWRGMEQHRRPKERWPQCQHRGKHHDQKGSDDDCDKKSHKSYRKGHKGYKHHKGRKQHKGHRKPYHEPSYPRKGDRRGHSKAPEPWDGFQGTPGKRDESWTCEGTPAPGSM
ncbi:BQ2448_6862 [Microbotryum intermedium]|uniref:BQ2448_6862 protein n=1 Tax=Microbotryum intermedium TaxID=269621 RepID=A0A238FI63_9BASI|nr:BQ2448_6862 [Microbotryum intermedium]